MFQNLPEQPADKILQLMQMYREDTRDGKIDLGVGVYRNAGGRDTDHACREGSAKEGLG